MMGLSWGRARRWLARWRCDWFGCNEAVFWSGAEKRWVVRCRRCHDYWLIPPCGRCYSCAEAEKG